MARANSERHIRAGLMLSGLLIGLSFVTMLIPLALYHFGQVAATLRLRTTYGLLAIVILSIAALGLLLGQDILFLGAFVGAFWAPLFAIAVYQRKKNKRPYLSAVLFFLPVFLTLGLALSFPRIENFPKFLEESQSQVEKGLRVTQKSMSDAEFQHFLNNWRENLKTARATPEFQELSRIVAYPPAARVAWLVYNSQAAYFFLFGLVLNALASLVFLDHAFAQVEKLRAVARYVKGLAGSFPHTLAQGLSQLPLGDGMLSVHVSGHRRVEDSALVSAFLLPKKARGSVYLGGYMFEVDESHGPWRLQNFSMPLPLVLLTLLFLVGTVFYFGTPENLVLAVANLGVPGRWIALGSVVATILLCVLSVQGMLVLYRRLTPLALMGFIALVFLAGLGVGLDPYAVLGFFGVIGLLDYRYDFRGRALVAT